MQNQQIPILYEDNHLLVVWKPAGILPQADCSGSPDMLTILRRYLRERYEKPGEAWLGLVHRLDRPVSGVMVFAKTSKAAGRLSDSLRRNTWEKIYLAAVHGIFRERGGRLQNELSPKMIDGQVRVVTSGKGKVARLQWQLLWQEQAAESSVLAIRLETGRRHQIRVQLAASGHPIIGDRRYGRGDKQDLAIKAPALQASLLSFAHPIKRTFMSFAVPLQWNEAFSSYPAEIIQDELEKALANWGLRGIDTEPNAVLRTVACPVYK